MTALPLSILAFAAGVYLLIKVKREYLSSLFSVLAWLVILASVASIGYTTVNIVHHCCENTCEDGGRCRKEEKVIIKSCKGEGEESGCHTKSCHMEGDSCVMDKEACEKMIGKEACDKVCKERGRCIFGKDECKKYCTENGKACCMDKGGEEKKECCKKKE